MIIFEKVVMIFSDIAYNTANEKASFDYFATFKGNVVDTSA